MPILIRRAGVTYLDITYLVGDPGTAVVLAPRGPGNVSASEEQRFPWEPRCPRIEAGCAMVGARMKCGSSQPCPSGPRRRRTVAQSPMRPASLRASARPRTLGQLKSAESRWLLVKNPRYGDVASEPEYIWVEEDKVPTTIQDALPWEKADHRAARDRGSSTVSRRGRQDQSAPGRGAPVEASASPPAAPTPTRLRPRILRPRGPRPTASRAAPVAAKQGVVLYVDSSRVASTSPPPTDCVRAGC